MKHLILFLLLAPLQIHATSSSVVDNGPGKPAFVHCVYFWLKEDVTAAQKAEFMDLLRSLGKIKSVKHIYVGYPAKTPRAIVDNSYDVALIVQFKDRAGHDLYQADQIHLDAKAIFEPYIGEIKIYDMINE